MDPERRLPIAHAAVVAISATIGTAQAQDRDQDNLDATALASRRGTSRQAIPPRHSVAVAVTLLLGAWAAAATATATAGVAVLRPGSPEPTADALASPAFPQHGRRPSRAGRSW